MENASNSRWMVITSNNILVAKLHASNSQRIWTKHLTGKILVQISRKCRLHIGKLLFKSIRKTLIRLFNLSKSNLWTSNIPTSLQKTVSAPCRCMSELVHLTFHAQKKSIYGAHNLTKFRIYWQATSTKHPRVNARRLRSSAFPYSLLKLTATTMVP